MLPVLLLCLPFVSASQNKILKTSCHLDKNPLCDTAVTFVLLPQDAVSRIDTVTVSEKLLIFFLAEPSKTPYMVSVPVGTILVGGDPDWMVLQFSNGRVATVQFDNLRCSGEMLL